MSHILLQLQKLEEVEANAKTTIQRIQQQIDGSAKQMTTENAEYQKQKQELEEKYQKENSELEAKNWERNANFVKEMATLKERLKDKVNWSQVDLLMGTKLFISIANPLANRWNLATAKKYIAISNYGLTATNNGKINGWHSVSAEQGFTIAVDSSRPVLFYFEVANMSSYKDNIILGLSSGNILDGSIFIVPNSYAFHGGCDQCRLSGKSHPFEWPNGAIKPEWNGQGDVIGCGLLMNPAKELFIFFTANGILMGKQIPINTIVNTLYPTLSLLGNISVEANFGNNTAKPFCYDIKKCQGMVFK